MKNRIIGRAREKEILERLCQSGDSEFLAIYGRRRVGKTFLIREFFEDEEVYFELVGQKDSTLQEQLKNFADAFSKRFLSHQLATPSTWNEALKMLAAELDQRKSKGKVVIFFDEVPWLASRRSKFLQALDYFWNTWASRKKNVIVVVCGSASSWMINKIVHNKGGLHNRLTQTIALQPFTLAETEELLKDRHISLARKDILELYMAVGGVPHYLKAVERGKSAAQNIESMCFARDGLLRDEFRNLYSALFENSANHEKIVEALAKTRKGLPREELLRITGVESGGTITQVLRALEESSFIAKYLPFRKTHRDFTYRLIDEYSMFYLSWIQKAPARSAGGLSKNYWLQQRSQRSWTAWAGYTFEGLCWKHVQQIKDTLGIAAVSADVSSWTYRPKRKGEQGAQIDLLIDRADNCITICEMKYSDSEFTITKKYAEELRNKLDVFKSQTGTRKSLLLAMVTTHGVKKNSYSEELVDSHVTADALFAAS